MTRFLFPLFAVLLLEGCKTGFTPEEKANARKDTQAALQKIYAEHKGARTALQKSLAFLVCTGSDTYLFAADSGGEASAYTSFDVNGVKVFQSAIWGAVAQATVQGYNVWKTDFTDDFISNSE